MYLVGGAVRDLLLGGAPIDLDLAVEGDAASFAASLGGDLRVHDRFGTSTVDARRVQLRHRAAPAARRTRTRARSPTWSPRRWPRTCSRRDFTVNAIALALAGDTAGELTARAGALEDLDARRLRVLHDRSFIDDPTRLLRLVRYASRLGFEIEPHTRALADDGDRRAARSARSADRGSARSCRLLAREPDPVGGARAGYATSGSTSRDPPGLRPRDDEDARSPGAGAPAGRRATGPAGARGGRDEAYRAAELTALLDALAFDADDRDAIVAAATRAGEVASALAAASTPSEIAAAVAGRRPSWWRWRARSAREPQAREWLDALRHVRLEIDGRDLLAAGVPEGPAIGRGLRAALAAKLDRRASGREQELAEAVRAAGERR